MLLITTNSYPGYRTELWENDFREVDEHPLKQSTLNFRVYSCNIFSVSCGSYDIMISKAILESHFYSLRCIQIHLWSEFMVIVKHNIDYTSRGRQSWANLFKDFFQRTHLMRLQTLTVLIFILPFTQPCSTLSCLSNIILGYGEHFMGWQVKMLFINLGCFIFFCEISCF